MLLQLPRRLCFHPCSFVGCWVYCCLFFFVRRIMQKLLGILFDIFANLPGINAWILMEKKKLGIFSGLINMCILGAA